MAFKGLTEIREQKLKIPFREIDNIEQKSNYSIFKENTDELFYLRCLVKSVRENINNINQSIDSLNRENFLRKIDEIKERKEKYLNCLKKMEDDLKRAKEDIETKKESLNRDIEILKNQKGD